jgi:hypothetical protein
VKDAMHRTASVPPGRHAGRIAARRRRRPRHVADRYADPRQRKEKATRRIPESSAARLDERRPSSSSFAARKKRASAAKPPRLGSGGGGAFDRQEDDDVRVKESRPVPRGNVPAVNSDGDCPVANVGYPTRAGVRISAHHFGEGRELEAKPSDRPAIDGHALDAGRASTAMRQMASEVSRIGLAPRP